MSRSRRLAVGAAAVVATTVLIPTTATAAPDQNLRGLRLSGEGCAGLKTVVVTPRTPFLFAPLQLINAEDAKPSGKWLFPYEIAVFGEGLKTRHMIPGETYTRPGRPPKNQVTCSFTGETKEGPFSVDVTGPIRGR
ncbi:MAG: hypothetical protein IPG68_05895 [Micrococcales bacterium]|nr:hypothetical protein [Micrococcales bacterium]